VKLLDTTVAIDHLRGADAARQLLRGLTRTATQVGASELVRFELHAGVREDELSDLRDFSATLLWVPVDTDSPEWAERLLAAIGPASAGSRTWTT
jgi:hypothetical protein